MRDRTKRYGETVLWYGRTAPMSRAVCPGSFDPVTYGHLDIIGRAAQLFDEVVVAVGVNQSKSRLFSPEERLEMLTAACADLPNVRVEGFTGLVTDFCSAVGAKALVKGLRSSSDFDYELPMAHMNRALTEVETVFLPASTGQSFVELEPGQGGGGPRRRRRGLPAAGRARAAAGPARRAIRGLLSRDFARGRLRSTLLADLLVARTRK